MNILNFVNSKDIKNYLLHIDYNFSTIECAWLVYQSAYTTLNEKHSAFNEILETMPDEPLIVKNNTFNSIKSYIRHFVSNERILLKEFFKNDKNCVYSYSVFFDYYGFSKLEYGRVFSNYENCIENIKERVNTLDFNNIEVIKFYFDNSKRIKLYLNSNMKISSVISSGFDYAKEILFNEFKIHIPIPFKKGDILYDSKALFDDNVSGGPFVFIDVLNENSSLLANGYFENEKGKIFNSYHHCYMDLEFVTIENQTVSNSLVAFSNYIKNDSTLNEFLSLYYEEIYSKTKL